MILLESSSSFRKATRSDTTFSSVQCRSNSRLSVRSSPLRILIFADMLGIPNLPLFFFCFLFRITGCVAFKLPTLRILLFCCFLAATTKTAEKVSACEKFHASEEKTGRGIAIFNDGPASGFVICVFHRTHPPLTNYAVADV